MCVISTTADNISTDTGRRAGLSAIAELLYDVIAKLRRVMSMKPRILQICRSDILLNTTARVVDDAAVEKT